MIVETTSGKKFEVKMETNSDANPGQINHNCSDMIKFPDFNLESMPYVLVRTKHGIWIIDCFWFKMYHICEEEKPDFDNSFMAIGKCEGGIQVIYSCKKMDASFDSIKSFLI